MVTRPAANTCDRHRTYFGSGQARSCFGRDAGKFGLFRMPRFATTPTTLMFKALLIFQSVQRPVSPGPLVWAYSGPLQFKQEIRDLI